ncbi:MAG: ABC transporter permease subunit [Spirochaetota bacterium]
MSGLGSVVRKELRSYFNSPIAYIVVVIFLVFASVWFFVIQDFFGTNIASLRGYYGVLPIVFVFLVPAITMRMWSEERRAGTDEVLLTLPLRERDLVVGKYLAGIVLLAIAIGLTVFVPITVLRFGDFERGEIVGQYVGLLLLGSAGVAIGQLVSSLSRNQISAFLFGALMLLALTLVARVNSVAELPSWLAGLVNYLSLDYHYRGFNRGIVDTRDLVYFVALTAAGLYATTRVLIARKIR